MLVWSSICVITMDSSLNKISQNSCEGIEVFSHHGVILKNTNYRDDEANYNGNLIVKQYGDRRIIEWKPIAVSEIVDCSSEHEEHEEWAMVATVENQRVRTSSGGLIHSINIPFSEINSYLVDKSKWEITLYLKDGSVHAFKYQFGNVLKFAYFLGAFLHTKRSRNPKNLFLVVEDTSKADPLSHSFAELNLFTENPTYAVWRFVTNFKQRPVETALQSFSHLTDKLLFRQDEKPREEEVKSPLRVAEADIHEESAVEDEGYTIVDLPSNLPKRKVMSRGEPLSIEQWKDAMDEEGRIRNPNRIKEIVFRGGVSKQLRFLVWKYLLGYFPWNSTAEERQLLQKHKTEEYMRLKAQWSSISPDQEERFAAYRERKSLIEKDVVRTDRNIPYYAGDNNPNIERLREILMTYVMYNFDLGYVQGMSDLLSPILMLMTNEVDAFWCFVGFMNRVKTNFDLDQLGMKNQLTLLFNLISAADPELAKYLQKQISHNMYFCFRWILVLFKREFTMEDIMTLWEVLWTDLPCPNFLLLFSYAILDAQKNIIIANEYGFTEIVKNVNDLSMKIDLNSTLNNAESIYKQFTERVDLPVYIKKIIGLAEAPESDIECSDNDNDMSIIQDSDEENYERGLNQHYN